MTLPSISELSLIAARTIKRFPLAMLAAYVLTILAIIYNHRPNDILFGYIVTCIFAFPFATSIDLFMESKKAKAPARFFVRLVTLVIIGLGYFYVFKNLEKWKEVDVLRFFLIEFAALTLVLFAPFVTRNKANAFWQYSIALIVRIFQAFVFFGIFFLGIVLLLHSIDYLFEVDISELYYFDVWLVLAGIFASMFSLSGVPWNFARLEHVKSSPKFLDVLTDYFLVPLTFLYLIVLYAYAGKIAVTWQWPTSGVVWWIMGFSFVGMIAYFFAYAVKDRSLHYVEFFRRWFFPLLVPLIVVLDMAIWIRINEYGLTENRYLVVAFGVWVLVMAVYYIATRTRSLKFMPISLFVILVLSIYGPQSVFEVSKASQGQRLETLGGSGMNELNDNIFYYYMHDECFAELNSNYACVRDMGGYRYYVDMVVSSGLPLNFDIKDKKYLVELKDKKLLTLSLSSGAPVFNLNLEDFTNYLKQAFPGKQEIPMEKMSALFQNGMLRIRSIGILDNMFDNVEVEILMK